jgi:predicted transcriptional regulator
MTEDPAAAVFEALSDPVRRRLLAQISAQPATATELAAELPISRQAVAKHLSSLAHAGLLASSAAAATCATASPRRRSPRR